MSAAASLARTLRRSPLWLAAFGVGLLGYAFSFVLARSFYSRQNARTPALLNAGLLALYVALAFTLSRTMELTGVALAFS